MLAYVHTDIRRLCVIISILNQKGGVGKTTLAVNLTRFFAKKGNTLLVDSDPQGSARTWHEKTDGEMLNLVALDRPTLSKDVLKFSNFYDWIIIDGVPQVSNMTIAAIKCSDLVLIPVQPSPYDIWATYDTVRFVKDYQETCNGKLKAAFIISRKIVNTKLGKDITSELEKLELPVFKFGTCQRVAYAETAAVGLTVLDTKTTEAQNEIEQIGNEIGRFTNGIG